MSKQTIIIFMVLMLALGAGLFFLNGAARQTNKVTILSDSEGSAHITINDQILTVLIADTSAKQRQGLSGIDFDAFDKDGMLFVFDDQKERTFWMNEMLFDLDIVWIRNGQIAKIEENIVTPGEGGEIRYMHSEPHEVDMVLELPAGGVDKYDLAIGQAISF